jgi:hypothetical protein
LGLAVGVCAKQMIPATEKSIAEMTLIKMGRVRVESAPAELRCLPELRAQASVSPGFC